jgi:hydroxymethylpyrimidine/phosphomethylpyrimidine kinase
LRGDPRDQKGDKEIIAELRRKNAALCKELTQARHALRGDWKCERCHKWKTDSDDNHGEDCDLCASCAAALAKEKA